MYHAKHLPEGPRRRNSRRWTPPRRRLHGRQVGEWPGRNCPLRTENRAPIIISIVDPVSILEGSLATSKMVNRQLE